MARDHGRIYTRIWNDRDFLALETGPQRFYLFLVTQPNLSKAGVLPVTLRRWAASAPDLTTRGVLALLSELDRARFIVWDDETEELLIRTFIRGDEVYKQPNMMHAATSAATEIVSPRLRRVLLAELDRLPLDEVKSEPTKSGGQSARAVVEACIETMRRTLAVPEPTPDPERRGTLPGRVPERVSETLPGTHAEPLEGRVVTRDAETHPDSLGGFAQESTEAVQVSGSWGTLPETLPEWVPETPYARACTFPLPLDPSPNPIPPSAGGEPPRQQPTLTLVETGTATAVESTPPQTADQLIAYWLENVPKRPPGSIIGRVGKSIKTMLSEGIDPADIAAGLEAWATRGKDPSVLPSIVNEVMNAGGADRVRSGRPAAGDLGGDAHLNRYLARAAARKAREA